MLRRLDSSRKSSVLQFLYETVLIDREKPIVKLSGISIVTDVKEVTVTASENGRDALRQARHALERAAYALRLEEEPEEDRRCREVLNAWDEERGEADGRVDELESVEEPKGSEGGPDGGVLSPRVQGGHPGDDKERRVDRLVYEGMSRRLARAAVYGGGVLGDET